MLIQLNKNSLLNREPTLSSEPKLSIYFKKVAVKHDLKAAETIFNSAVSEAKKLLSTSSTEDNSKIISRLNDSKDQVINKITTNSIGLFISTHSSGYTHCKWTKSPLVIVSSSFHIKPIIREVTSRLEMLTLTISSKAIKLFMFEKNSLTLLDSKEVLNGLYDESAESAIPEKKLKESQIKIINDMISKHVSSATTPLVLAGPKANTKRFMNEVEHPNILNSIVGCNPEKISTEDFTKLLKPIYKKYKAESYEKVLSEVSFCEKNKRPLDTIHDIAQAAINGQIDKLVISDDDNVWGILNKSNGEVIYHSRQLNSKDDDILDELAETVLNHRGEVYVLPKKMLNDKVLYATLRW